MTRHLNLYQAKTQLSRLVEDAAKGEEIVIAKNGKPMARLVGAHAESDKPKNRVGGQWAKYMTAEERKDFGSPAFWRRWRAADDEILRDFEVLNDEYALNEPQKDFEWGNTSSTPMRSSTSKPSRASSGQKPIKRSRPGKTRSS